MDSLDEWAAAGKREIIFSQMRFREGIDSGERKGNSSFSSISGTGLVETLCSWREEGP